MVTPAKLNKFEEVYDIHFFHEKFKSKYPSIDLGEKGIRKTTVPLSLYKKIVSTYFDTYMKEVYFMGGIHYFLFGGSLRICSSGSGILNIGTRENKIYKKKPMSIAFFWNERPGKLFNRFLNIIKLTGKWNKLPAIEKVYKENFDLNLLPKFEEVIIASYKNKKKYDL